MNHERSFVQDAGEYAAGTQPILHVVIVYDGRSAGTQAMNLFSGLVQKFGDEFEFHCGLWRFDVLGLSEAQEEIVRAGATADLLIVAGRCDTDLPASVKNWLAQCVAGKDPASVALVGLLESPCGPTDAECHTRQFLRKVADRSRMDLFLHEVDPAYSALGHQRVSPGA